jgi:hypothetical protein
MPIILDNNKNYIVCGGPQINPNFYNMIIGGPNCPPPKEEEEDGIQSTSNR